MEQPDPAQVKAREYVAVQIGDQVIRMCEMQAKIDAQAAQIETLTQALDAAQKKAGTE